jgi:hypothetical protein
MPPLNIDEVKRFVEQHIGAFHDRRLQSISELRLKTILIRKNPYLFKAKNLLTAQDIIKTLLDAHLSSQEEGMFGNFLEDLAIFICGKVYGGRKSPAEGIDMEFEKDRVTYLLAIKSGPNWGNSSQIARMRENFVKAKKIIRANSRESHVVAVNGCCYGRDNKPDKGNYFKYCGQNFWEFISGNSNLYTDIIKPLGHKAKEKNQQFYEAYAQLVNKFTREFSDQFCTKDGIINWEALVKFNSSTK